MTKEADFKAVIRERMRRTGENYTTARAALQTERDVQVREIERFREKTLRSFVDGDLRAGGSLRSIPVRRKQRVVVLLELIRAFEIGRRYPETEVNSVLRPAHHDVALLRRELVEYGYLKRANAVYWVNVHRPPRSGAESQETALLEDDWFAGLKHDGHSNGRAEVEAL